MIDEHIEGMLNWWARQQIDFELMRLVTWINQPLFPLIQTLVSDTQKNSLTLIFKYFINEILFA